MGDLLSNKDNVIVYLAAQGKSATEIAEVVGIPVSTIRTILAKEHVQFEVGHLRHKLYGRDAKKKWNEMYPKAQEAVERVLDNPNLKPSLHLHAAEIVLDRSEGKPKQSVEVHTSLVREIYDRLKDGKKEKPVLDITPVANSEETQETEPSDPVEAWVKKNL